MELLRSLSFTQSPGLRFPYPLIHWSQWSLHLPIPDGTSYHERISYNTNEFSASRNQNTQVLHIDPHQKGSGADLVFTRDPPSWQAGNGKWYFDKSLTQYWGWFPSFPSAKVQGTLTYGGQVHKVQELLS
jgi:hypothetical protein